MSQAPEDRPAPETIETELLVRRTLEGDFEAFEHWVMRHERRVLTFAVRILRDLEDAQDASQEVFLRAFRFLHRLDTRRPAEPWLMRITVNVCRDMQRKKKRRGTPSDVSEIDSLPTGDPIDPHAGLAREQQRQILWKAIDALPEKERLALILRDVEGLSTAETAEILASSEATVRSQICRGRLKLKHILELEGTRGQ